MATAPKVQNRQVNGQSNYRRAAPIFHAEQGHRMHMLIAALDYKKTGRPMTCTAGARHLEELARQCGAHYLVPMYNDECTREAVLRSVREMASKCGADDVFVFYFAGHGMNDEEAGGQEEAFVLVDRDGQVSADTLLPSSHLTNMVLDCCNKSTRILIMTDTSLPGTMVDLGKKSWVGRQAVLLAGVHNSSSPEEDRGNIFTHAVLLAIDKLSKVGRDNYSVGMLFNAALHENDLVFGGKQDFVIQAAPKFSADAMAWPLVPPVGYQAPLSRCAGSGGVQRKAAAVGISPALVQHVHQEALNIPVSIEEYISYIQGQSFFQLKPCRACSASSGSQCSLQ